MKQTNPREQVFCPGLEQVLELVGVDACGWQFVPNGALNRRRNHVLAHFLPEEFHLSTGSGGAREIKIIIVAVMD